MNGNAQLGRDHIGRASLANDVGMRLHLPIMHNAPPKRKCLLHHRTVYRDPMESPADRLKAAREKSGYDSAKGAAEAMGVPVATYIQHENGSRGYPAERAARYARFFRTTPEWLLYGRELSENLQAAQLGPQLPVQGSVAAGVWREVLEHPESEWTYFTGSPDVRAPINHRFGLKVEGNSMDIPYPPGTVIECVRYWGDEPIPNGKRVVVQRTRFDGEIETTVKEYQRDEDGIEWLVPRSTNPAFQAPFRCDEPGEGIEKIEVVAWVVASIRYE